MYRFLLTLALFQAFANCQDIFLGRREVDMKNIAEPKKEKDVEKNTERRLRLQKQERACRSLYVDTPFGQEVFRKESERQSVWKGRATNTIAKEGDKWVLKIGHLHLMIRNADDFFQPPEFGKWTYTSQVGEVENFDIVIHCDRCEDDADTSCKEFSERGYCEDLQYREFMRRNCPSACSICTAAEQEESFLREETLKFQMTEEFKEIMSKELEDTVDP